MIILIKTSETSKAKDKAKEEEKTQKRHLENFVVPFEHKSQMPLIHHHYVEKTKGRRNIKVTSSSKVSLVFYSVIFVSKNKIVKGEKEKKVSSLSALFQSDCFT